MRQPTWAAPTFGGAIVAGVAAALISGYKMADCLRFQSKPGECSEVIEGNALPLVAGIAAIAGPLAGFFTLNPDLDSSLAAGRRRRWDEAPEPEPLPVVIDGPEPLPIPDPPDENEEDLRADAARAMRAEGLTQQEIADRLNVSRSTVSRILKA
jgi:hypothetical protein